MSISVFEQCVNPDPSDSQVLTDMPPLKTKEELQTFLSILNYPSNFSPATGEVCEPLCKLTSVKNRLDMEQNVTTSV